jgi:hypothetical protein
MGVVPIRNAILADHTPEWFCFSRRGFERDDFVPRAVALTFADHRFNPNNVEAKFFIASVDEPKRFFVFGARVCENNNRFYVLFLAYFE